MPLAVLIVAVFTVHFVAVFKYEWQWTLTKWGYPLFCVGALFALVWLRHWTVRSGLLLVVVLMFTAGTAGYAYKRGLEDNGGLYQQRVDLQADAIVKLNTELASANEKIATLANEVAEAKKVPSQSENSSIATSDARKPVRAYRSKPAPSFWDFLP